LRLRWSVVGVLNDDLVKVFWDEFVLGDGVVLGDGIRLVVVEFSCKTVRLSFSVSNRMSRLYNLHVLLWLFHSSHARNEG